MGWGFPYIGRILLTSVYRTSIFMYCSHILLICSFSIFADIFSVQKILGPNRQMAEVTQGRAPLLKLGHPSLELVNFDHKRWIRRFSSQTLQPTKV